MCKMTVWDILKKTLTYGEVGEDLRKQIALLTRKISTLNFDSNSLESFLACRLIPIDKNPGVRPIGVGEILRRIVRKVITAFRKNDVLLSSNPLEMSSGLAEGCEAAIHAMGDEFYQENTEAVLLVDAANAFNAINRKTMLHNVDVICPEISQFVNNCSSKA